MSDKSTEFYSLTFSQREGKVRLPNVMQIEHIPQMLRQMAWLYIDKEINSLTDVSGDFYGEIFSLSGIPVIVWDFKFKILGIPHDEIRPPDPSKDKEFSRGIILYKKYHETITFLEYILRHDQCCEMLYDGLTKLFEDSMAAYLVEKINGMPTIIPRRSREDGHAIQQALETLRQNGMDGATTHLRQAAEHINARQYADAITDCIHAVESVARIIAPKSSTTLGPALHSLEQAGVLNHPALKQAFLNLYGYTSDEQGLRHALLDQNAANVSLEEAVFMFGACASFAAYLTQKHRRAGEA